VHVRRLLNMVYADCIMWLEREDREEFDWRLNMSVEEVLKEADEAARERDKERLRLAGIAGEVM
jgi:hypothetical protein